MEDWESSQTPFYAAFLIQYLKKTNETNNSEKYTWWCKHETPCRQERKQRAGDVDRAALLSDQSAPSLRAAFCWLADGDERSPRFIFKGVHAIHSLFGSVQGLGKSTVMEQNGVKDEQDIFDGFKPAFKSFATEAIHVGQEPEQWNSMAVVPPISLSTTFKQDEPGKHAVSSSTGETSSGKHI